MQLATVAGNSILLSLGANLTIATPLTMNTGAPNFRSSINAGGNDVWTGPIQINGNTGFAQLNAGATTSTPGLNLAGPITGTNAVLLVRGAGLGEISGQVNDAGGTVFHTDAGNWIVASTNNNWALTEIVGEMQNGANNAFPVSSVMEIGQAGASAGRLELAGFNQQLASLFRFSTGTATGLNCEVQNLASTNTSVLTITTATNDVCVPLIAGAIQLVMNGSGTLQLANTQIGPSANSYTGGTIVENGVLQMAANNELPLSGDVTVSGATSTATLDLNAHNTTIGALSGTSSSSVVALGGATFTIGNNSTNSTSYSGTIADAGGASAGTGGTVIMEGNSTLNLVSPNGQNIPNLIVSSGTVNFGATSTFTSTPNGPVVSGGGLTSAVNITGSLAINNATRVAMNPSAPGHGVVNSIGALSIDSGSVLDIGNHTVLVQSAPDETVIGGYLSNGYAGGFWNGTSPSGGAINSIVAFNDNTGATSIGYGNSADFTFGGSTSPYRVGGPKALSGNGRSSAQRHSRPQRISIDARLFRHHRQRLGLRQHRLRCRRIGRSERSVPALVQLRS
jgi:fibronectin-binding autotransporter adhesin